MDSTFKMCMCVNVHVCSVEKLSELHQQTLEEEGVADGYVEVRC